MSGANEADHLVLFADDDRALHGLMSEFLQQYGYRVECHSNGTDALSAFRRNRHDFIITDLLMPGLNGYEFLRELRALDPGCLKRTIVLTGASRETWQWFERDSVAAFLTKPVDLSRLIEQLRNCDR